MKCAKSN